MRLLAPIALAAILLAGCNQNQPAPTPVQSPPVEPPPASVEIGGPQGGIHVDDPASGTRVQVGGPQGGVHVNTPESKVDVP